MKINGKHLLVLACFFLIFGLYCVQPGDKRSALLTDKTPFSAAHRIGRLEDDRLDECSGLDTSLATDNLLWAINDSGHGPFLYALNNEGLSRGRVLVLGAQNRDWEGLDTFLYQGRPMILIADFGDNKRQYDTHTLYVIEEPHLSGECYAESSTVTVAWRIVYSYPDGEHDAEGVAVDATGRKVLVLTKRDNPPLVFELPLRPPVANHTVVAQKVTAVFKIPQPSLMDLLQKNGMYRSQPTALDLSPNGLQAVVLTYKHAYVFNRSGFDSWAAAFNEHPLLIPLPLPQDRRDFSQREAICFVADGSALLTTSEGRGAGIFRLEPK